MWILTLSISLLLPTKSSTIVSYQNAVEQVISFQQNMVLEDSLIEYHQTYLDHLLVELIFPYWYGTPWDFNGYSNVPAQGEIACGYFVSTPLKHIGYNWNRFRLAQQDATTIIRKIAGNNIMFYNNQTSGVFLEKVKKLKDGLYILGLDSHVGFLYKTSKDIRIIHSSYYGKTCVMNESAPNCPALDHSNSYVLGRLNSKENLFRLKNKTPINI